MKLRLFVLLTCVYLAFASREQPWGDAHVVYETSQHLVDAHRIDVNLGGPPQFYAIRNGRKYGVFPLGNVLAMAPSYVVYKLLLHIPHAPAELLFKYTCHLSTSMLMAGVCVLFFVLARRHGASDAAAAWLAIGLGTTTILAVYARVPFSEALQTLALTWTVERALSLGDELDLGGAAWAGVALGLLFNTKLIYIFLVPVVAAYVIARQRRELAKLFASLGVAAATFGALFLVAIVHNWVKTGSLLDSGYAIPGGVFSGNVYAAVFGFLLSPGKSIFLYTPPLVLALLALPTFLRRDRARGLFLLAVSGTVLLVNSKFRYWHADYCWGPRLLVPLTPTIALFVAPWIEPWLARGRRQWRALTVGALVGAGLFVQVLGCSFYWDHYIRIAIAVKDQTGAGGWYGEDLHHVHFIPQFSPLIGHAWLLEHAVRDDGDLMADPPWRRVIATPVNLTDNWHGLRGDLWIADWFLKGGPRGLMVAAVAWLLFLAVVIATTARGLARRASARPRDRR